MKASSNGKNVEDTVIKVSTVPQFYTESVRHARHNRFANEIIAIKLQLINRKYVQQKSGKEIHKSIFG